jgi:hypothetical protein
MNRFNKADVLSISKIIIILIFLLLVVYAKGFSQTSEKVDQQLIENLKHKPLHGFFGISFTNSVPQEEFMDNMQRSGQGFSLYGGYHADPLPLAVGIEGDLLFYGSQERRLDLKWKDPFGITHYYQDTASTQNMVVPIHVFFRVMPDMKFLIPYLEGFVGMTLLTTSYDYKSGLKIDDDYYHSSEDETDVAFSYGISAGVMVNIVDFITIPDSRVSMLFDLKLKYLKGGEANYWDWNVDENGQFHKKEYKSNTDLILLLAGITIRM